MPNPLLLGRYWPGSHVRRGVSLHGLGKVRSLVCSQVVLRPVKRGQREDLNVPASVFDLDLVDAARQHRVFKHVDAAPISLHQESPRAFVRIENDRKVPHDSLPRRPSAAPRHCALLQSHIPHRSLSAPHIQNHEAEDRVATVEDPVSLDVERRPPKKLVPDEYAEGRDGDQKRNPSNHQVSLPILRMRETSRGLASITASCISCALRCCTPPTVRMSGRTQTRQNLPRARTANPCNHVNRQNQYMLNPHAAEVVARLHDWAEDHGELIRAVWDRVIAPKGGWPLADDLTQEFFARGHTLDVTRAAANMPHALGQLEQGRVVLTVRGAQYYRPSHQTLGHYVKAVALAVDRYRTKHSEPAVTRSDMARLGLAGREVAHLERVLDGEKWALTKSGGNGSPVKYLLQPSAALALGAAQTLSKYLEAQANAWWQSESDVRLARISVRTSAPDEPPPASGLVDEHSELRFDWLHPAIQEASEPLMRAGHHREALLSATAVLREEVRRLGGLAALDGAPLMNAAFGSNKQPKVVVADRRSQTGKSVQQGIHHLALGVVAAVRNPLSHGLIDLTASEALERLAVMSLIYRHLDVASERRTAARRRRTQGA